MKYLMKKEAKNLRLTGALETENLGTLTASCSVSSVERRNPGAKIERLTVFFE